MQVKKSLLAGAALLLMASTAYAGTPSKVWTLFKGGYWETYGMAKNTDGVPMCGMQSGNDNKRLYIKWTASSGMMVQVWKSSWHLSQNDEVPFQLRFFDNAKPGESDTMTARKGGAHPSDAGVGSSVFMFINKEDMSNTLRIFSEADKMTIEFPQGDEPLWTVSMDGSRKAANEFMGCIYTIQQASGTQPILPKSTTQPIKPAEKITPTQPTTKKGSQVKDDGSI
jgi:hypothetical protein